MVMACPGNPRCAQCKNFPRVSEKLLICSALKRLAAILLMGILFFNWYGYQLLTQYWQQQAETRLQARLDRNEYDESQLLRVKIPITALAYSNDYSNTTGNFERINGNVDIRGVRYQYVKRRMFKDSLELLCIPNVTAMKLQQTKNDFFRQVNDLQQQNQGKKSPASPVKDLSKDYQPTAMDIAVPDALAAGMPAPGVYTCPHLPSSYAPTKEMPPDQAPTLS